MKTSVLLASAAALALTAGGASAGTAHPGVAAKSQTPSKHFTLKPHLGSTTLYNQDSGSNGVAIVSQNFTDFTSGAYNAYGADDFVIPGTAKHKVTAVFANGGYFGWPGPADSVNIVFYKKIKKGVGVLLGSCPSAGYSDLSGSGAFLVACTQKVKGGQHRWVSASVNMAFNTGGEWYWLTNNTQNGKPAEWENPGGGFGTSCSAWGVLTTCISAGEGPDFAFALVGN
jgi:hypothetical protein